MARQLSNIKLWINKYSEDSCDWPEKLSLTTAVEHKQNYFQRMILLQNNILWQEQKNWHKNPRNKIITSKHLILIYYRLYETSCIVLKKIPLKYIILSLHFSCVCVCILEINCEHIYIWKGGKNSVPIHKIFSIVRTGVKLIIG